MPPKKCKCGRPLKKGKKELYCPYCIKKNHFGGKK